MCVTFAGIIVCLPTLPTLAMPNQNSEQIARDQIDAQLMAAGWAVQDKQSMDPNVGEGQAVREYTTDVGPADYMLFVDKKPIGVVEATRWTSSGRAKKATKKRPMKKEASA